MSDAVSAYHDIWGIRIRNSVSTMKIDGKTESFDDITEGKADDLPEQAFLYVGTLDEVREKAKAMA